MKIFVNFSKKSSREAVSMKSQEKASWLGRIVKKSQDSAQLMKQKFKNLSRKLRNFNQRLNDLKIKKISCLNAINYFKI